LVTEWVTAMMDSVRALALRATEKVSAQKAKEVE
jgi:hypothetical protein